MSDGTRNPCRPAAKRHRTYVRLRPVVTMRTVKHVVAVIQSRHPVDADVVVSGRAAEGADDRPVAPLKR